MSIKILIATAICGFVCNALTPSVRANLVTNGNFSLAPGQNSGEIRTGYQPIAGWSDPNGLIMDFTPGTADLTTSPEGPVEPALGTEYLWGPQDGSANGMPSTSPVGGDYLAGDGSYEEAPVSQTINGLIAGDQYILTFYEAGAQDYVKSGDTTDFWYATLGSQYFATPINYLTSHGFAPWTEQQFTYTATSTSEVLSFLAQGTPGGLPPYALLAGVDLEPATPNTPVNPPSSAPDRASTLVLLGITALGVCIVARRGQRPAAAA